MLDFSGKTKQEIGLIMKKRWLCQLAFGLACIAAAFFVCRNTQSHIAFIFGVLWGLVDNGIILGSTVLGLGLSPRKIKIMHIKRFICRAAAGVIIIVVMLGLKLRAFEAFIGFILLHIFFIINLKNFTAHSK